MLASGLLRPTVNTAGSLTGLGLAGDSIWIKSDTETRKIDQTPGPIFSQRPCLVHGCPIRPQGRAGGSDVILTPLGLFLHIQDVQKACSSTFRLEPGASHSTPASTVGTAPRPPTAPQLVCTPSRRGPGSDPVPVLRGTPSLASSLLRNSLQGPRRFWPSFPACLHSSAAALSLEHSGPSPASGSLFSAPS